VFGFAGVATALHSDILSIEPRLPAAWTRLAFPLMWQGTPVFIDVTREAVAVTNKGEEALVVRLCGKRCTVAPGDTVRDA
jgi:hypothetical glycosyl hydrolase